jgi:RNA polymerase sigma-70 factor (ECF subfamily)
VADAFTTTQVVQSVLDRAAAGDAGAREELIRVACNRLERLVHKQLRGFPLVRRWENTEDVLQWVLMRLWRALEQVELRDARHFFALSSKHIRFQLLELKDHYYGPHGLGRHHASDAPGGGDGAGMAAAEQAGDDTFDPAVLAEWTEFHRKVEAMPDELRQVVDLLWYHELEHAEAANLLGVSAKTVGRRWREARLHLGASLIS